MIAAFVNDLKFYDCGDGLLYVRGYDRNFWKRYYRYFDKLYVVGRRFEVSKSDVEGMEVFAGDPLEFYEVPSLHSITRIIKDSYKVDLAMERLTKIVDCIITRQPSTNSNKIINACKKYKKPYLVELAGCPRDALWNHSWRGKLLAYQSFSRTKKNIKEAEYVIYVTDSFLQKRYPTKGKNIGCSDVALPPMEKNVLEKRLGHISARKDKDQLHIVTVGAVGIKYKGHQYMIQALAKSKNNMIYHIIGSGDSTKLRRLSKKLLVSDQVIFHGSMKHDDIFDFFDDMDIYIQPSDTEGLPRALIEAMSRGLPCLGTKVGGIPELLDKDFLFSKGSHRVEEIIQIINKFSPTVMKEQAEKNYYKALKYQENVTCERRKEIFYEFLNHI